MKHSKQTQLRLNILSILPATSLESYTPDELNRFVLYGRTEDLLTIAEPKVETRGPHSYTWLVEVLDAPITSNVVATLGLADYLEGALDLAQAEYDKYAQVRTGDRVAGPIRWTFYESHLEGTGDQNLTDNWFRIRKVDQDTQVASVVDPLQ